MKRIVALLIVLTVGGCAGSKTKETPVVLPEIIEVPVKHYVEIPDYLTKICEWADTGLPSQVFDRTTQRKECLLIYERQLQTIKKIQGTPVPEEKPR